MTRIDYNGGYLYCRVSPNPSDYLDPGEERITTPRELYEALLNAIIQGCRERGYTLAEIGKVCGYYETYISNHWPEGSEK